MPAIRNAHRKPSPTPTIPLSAEEPYEWTNPAAAAKRATPSESIAQPSQKNRCRPCNTPYTIGNSSANTPEARVTNNMLSDGSFIESFSALPLKYTHTNATTANENTTMPMAICSRASRLWSSFVFASAALCVKTACKPMAGIAMRLSNCSIAVNAPYSALASLMNG